MSIAKSATDTNVSIGRMVRLISEIGPRVPEIARQLGRHKETVRYWYKELIKAGFTVQASPNLHALGLRRIVMVVDFTDEFKPHAEAVLAAIRESCYLHSYAKTLPHGNYVINANVPKQHVGPWVELMRRLRENGPFSFVETFAFEWTREIPMRSESYDFGAGRWDFDWSKRLGRHEVVVPPVETQSEGGTFDRLDLILIEQLEADATDSFIEIQKDVKENYKTLNWHYRNHVARRGLIKGYRINWAGTYYDRESDRAMHRKHRYAWIELIIRDVSEAEKANLMSKVSELPFAWLESGGKDYHVQLAFPVEAMTEAMQFVEELIAPVRDRTKWFLIDQTKSLRFTINARLYDETTRSWRFQPDEFLASFDKLVVKTKNT